MAPKGSRPSRRRAASRSRRSRGRRSSKGCLRAPSRPASWTPAWRSPQLAEELVRLSHHSYTTTAEAKWPWHAPDDGMLQRIFSLVRNAVGIDFSEYKSATFERRLARRMALRRMENLQDYVKFLEQTPDEARALYEDVLIHVTSFFRDPEAFEVLKKQVFPVILKHKRQRERPSGCGRRGAPPGKRSTRSPSPSWSSWKTCGARVRSRSSARTSASRPSRRPAPGSTRTAPCAT